MPRLEEERNDAAAVAIMISSFSAIGSIDDVEAYLAASELTFPYIRPGLAKQVIWADPAGSVADWQADMREALDVAALLGERTLIIATSGL